MYLAEDETEDGASGTTPDDTTAEMTTPTDRVEVPSPLRQQSQTTIGLPYLTRWKWRQLTSHHPLRKQRPV